MLFLSDFPSLSLDTLSGRTQSCLLSYSQENILCLVILKKMYIGVELIYNVMLVSGVQQSDSVIHIFIYPFFFIFFSHIGYYRILSRAPCAIQ